MLTIDWIRHTSLRVDGSICYGQTDIQVSDTFEQEAALVREALKGRHYDAVYTSPLSRAARLADYCGFPDAIREPRVMELNFGAWENRTWKDLMRGRNADEWFDSWHKETSPDGEGLEDIFARVRDFVCMLLRRPELHRVAVFCHGGVINTVQYFNGEIERNECYRLVPPYGSINTIVYDRHHPFKRLEL